MDREIIPAAMRKSLRGSRIEELAERFGGLRSFAEKLNVGITALYNWRDKGIPDNQKWRIHQIARDEAVELPGWFFEDEVA